MCGRYFIPEDDEPEELARIMRALNRRGTAVKRGEIRPTDTAPVLANNRNRRVIPFAMRWGYNVSGKLLINVRSETAAEKPLFRESMLTRRCLIPATVYYEWNTSHVRYAFRREETLWMAGIYRPEGSVPAFTVLTREAGESVRGIHDRMPVIFSGEACESWLDLSEAPEASIGRALTDVEYERMGAEQISFEEFFV